MTIKFPSKTIGDKLLELIGKRRAIYFPHEINNFGPYGYYTWKKESILKALLRPYDKPLPKEAVEMDIIYDSP